MRIFVWILLNSAPIASPLEWVPQNRPEHDPGMIPLASLLSDEVLLLGETRRDPVPGQRLVNQLPRLMVARTRPVKVIPSRGVFRERE